MSFEQIEKEYQEITSEQEPYETLPKLISVVEKISKTLDKVEGSEELKSRTEMILNNLRKESRETFNREKVTTYLIIIKDILNLLRELIEKEEETEKRVEIETNEKTEKTKEKADIESLSEDINFIDRILEEEISEIEPVKTMKPKPEKEEKSLETLIYELENLKEYVRILSDKLFDIGEEILDIKERVNRLEEVFTNKPAKKIAAPPHVRDEEPSQKHVEKLTKIPEEFIPIKKLLDEANRELGLMDENVLKRAIKLESYKIQLEAYKDKVFSAPEPLKNEFERAYSKLIEQTNLLRKELTEKEAS